MTGNFNSSLSYVFPMQVWDQLQPLRSCGNVQGERTEPSQQAFVHSKIVHTLFGTVLIESNNVQEHCENG